LKKNKQLGSQHTKEEMLNNVHKKFFTPIELTSIRKGQER